VEKVMENYNRDHQRTRSLIGILKALRERHPDSPLMELLTSRLNAGPEMTDAELSERITRRLNAEVAEEPKGQKVG
jgi:hypothetical protein